MRLVTYRAGDTTRAGALTAAGVLDAAEVLGIEETGVRELIADGGVEELRDSLEGTDAPPISGAALLPPSPTRTRSSASASTTARTPPRLGSTRPTSPPSSPSSATRSPAPDATVKLPAASEKVDYEAEVAFVIGRRCKEVEAADALDAIAGYMLLNDLSARDLQFATPQWMPGKVFDGSAPCGPALVTPDEAGPPDAISFALDLNGERMQEASTSDLVFSIPELVARLSRWMTLEPGDIVSTGTPSGVGSIRQPRVWLKPGDEIVISSPSLGELRTTIA